MYEGSSYNIVKKPEVDKKVDRASSDIGDDEINDEHSPYLESPRGFT